MAHRVLPVALGVAGAVALAAPSPWRWLGAGATVFGLATFFISLRLSRPQAPAGSQSGGLQAEMERLVSQEGVHNALLSVLPIGVAALRSGQTVYANPTAVEILGQRVMEAGAPLPGVVRDLISSVDAGQPLSGLLDRHPGRLVEVTAHLCADDVVVLILADITERSRAETASRDFVSAASHELKTPAAAIHAAAETVLVALEDDPAAVREFTGRVLENAARLAQIVSHMLDLSRLESTGLRSQPFDLSELLAEEVARFGGSQPAISLQSESVLVDGNPSDVALAVRNLLDNAVRHTPDSGWVKVRTRSRPDEVEVEVADSGPGIPAADLPRVFERFYRVDEARSRARGGTGLGLAIVKQVADLHRGRVEVESQMGEGSVFRMRLPAKHPAPPSSGAG